MTNCVTFIIISQSYQNRPCSLLDHYLLDLVLNCIDRLYVLIGPQREKTCLRGFANNTGADQPAHPRSLISAFVIRFLDNTICKLPTGEISIFQLVSVA